MAQTVTLAGPAGHLLQHRRAPAIAAWPKSLQSNFQPSQPSARRKTTLVPTSALHQQDAALTSPQYRGLTPLAVEEAFRAEYPRFLEALASSEAAMTPASAAQLLRHLEAELPPALNDVAPSGDCVLVAISPGLLPLLEHSITCCEQALQAGCLDQAVATGKAVVCLLSSLRFGSPASAAPYAQAAVRVKQAIKAAYDAGAQIFETDIVEMHTASAAASPYLWLIPYFGHRFASAVDACVTANWSSGELAVRYTEAWASLVSHGRYTQQLDKFVRLVRAAMQHPLSSSQMRRLLACSKRLPVEMTIALELHARSEPADSWHTQILLRLDQEEEARCGVLLRTALAQPAAAVASVPPTASPAQLRA
ncbi:hypothetical protein D9Q98_010067 [Chlorella vulgaris]|uniref:Uncharacterized protein n=1 Tax=Chlorella vulgaris TaxID=3077 RepID=A0A9D4TMM9_CHLVU|nr:hypothetical protein D9Q98_010067 [Chlorella vulgaris]